MLLSQLPKPVRDYGGPSTSPTSTDSTITTLAARTEFEPPPYGSMERKKFVPRRAKDFGDGGDHCFPCTSVVVLLLDLHLSFLEPHN